MMIKMRIVALLACSWLGLTGFLVSFFMDFDTWGHFAWHLSMHAIALGLCGSISLVTAFDWRSAKFSAGWKRIIAVFVIVYPLSLLFGYKYDWGLYIAPVVYGVFFVLFSFCCVFFTWRILGLRASRRDRSPRYWRVAALVVISMLAVVTMLFWMPFLRSI